LAALGEDPGVLGDKLHALESIGDIYLALALYEKALEYYEKYEEISSKSNLKASILVKKGQCWMSHGLGKGDVSMSKQMLQKAKNLPNLNKLDLAEIENLTALLYYFCGNFESSCRHSLEAERLFEAAGEQRRLMTQLCDHAAADLGSGKVDMAIEELKTRGVDQSALPRCYLQLGHLLYQGL
jgi:tetratricopeptide (TPR) repeat protein